MSIIKELLSTYYWGGEGQQLPGLASYVWRANCQEGLSAVQMKSQQQAPRFLTPAYYIDELGFVAG